MNIFCGGMSRSGGTVQYQLVCEVAKFANLAKPIGFLTDTRYKQAQRDGYSVVGKSEPPQDWMLREVRRGNAKVFTIYRDPRQVCASLIRFFQARDEYRNIEPPDDYFDWVLEGPFRDALRWFSEWEQLPYNLVHVDCYEECHPDAWHLAVMDYADFLEVDLPINQSRLIAAKCSIFTNTVQIENLSRWINGNNLLTKAHIGPNEGDLSWASELTDEQINRVELEARHFMEIHGYEFATI